MTGRVEQGREIARWAVVGTLVCVLLVAYDVQRTGSNPLTLIQAGADGPSADLIARDFPDAHIADGVGLDGQQFYAMAEHALHPRDAAASLDRPRYRWQRPLLAWLGWALHPSGGGTGLIVALALVNVAAVLLGGWFTGVLGVRLGGAPWLAVLFGLLPGAFLSVRVTVADALGLALATGALGYSLAAAPKRAVAVAAAAVLAKEVTLLALGSWWLSQRTRSRLLLAAVPAAVALGWFFALLRLVPGPEDGISELALPFAGWWSAVADRWAHGEELWGMVASVAAVAAALAALVRRRLAHPLAGIVVAHLLFTTVCNGDVLGQEFGGTRSTMALLLFSLVMIFTPNRAISPPLAARA